MFEDEKHKDYARYAKQCLDQVEAAPNYRIRILLHKIAAEWSVVAEQAENEWWPRRRTAGPMATPLRIVTPANLDRDS